MKTTTFVSFVGTLLFLLTACGRSPSISVEGATLPLSEDKLTFIFFFTDN